MSRLPRLVALLMLAVLPARGQQAGVSLRLLAFPRSDDPAPVELLAGDQVVEVELAANRLTGPYKVPACDRWVFGRRAGAAGGGPQFDTWGAGKAAASAHQLVILFRRGPRNADGFRVVAYDAGPAEFGDRQLMFLNLTALRVGGDVGGEKFTLGPARHRVITPHPDQGRELCHATLMLRRDDRWQPFLTTNWPLKPGTRGLIVIYPDPQTGRIRLHTIRDLL